MAVVYRAQDTRHGRDVAVKVMLPSVSDAVGSERFPREIETAARLQHPNIVPVERTVDHGMYPYEFYAEYCPFMVPLRGGAAFDRILAKAARRVQEFNV